MIPYKDLSPSKNFPFISLFLILILVAVFIYQFSLPKARSVEFLYEFAAIPLEFKLGHNLPKSAGPSPIVTTLSALFLHGGLLHLAGNILYLWIFARGVEGAMGWLRFPIFYLLCGWISVLVQIYASYDSRLPIIGASGAIAGVLGAYIRLFPRAKIVVLIPIIYFLRKVTMPAWVVLGGWILIQFLAIHFSESTMLRGTAYYSHIGGFITGLVLLPAFIPANSSAHKKSRRKKKRRSK